MNVCENEIIELHEAESHIFNQVFSYISSMSLKCAVQLGIPDIIHKHGKPMSPSQLATALAIHPSKTPCVHRLMRFLVHTGFLKHEKLVDKVDEEGRESDEGYVLTGASKLLLKDNPLSLAAGVFAMLDPAMLEPWHHLHRWFRNDDLTPFVTTHGLPAFEFFGREPRVGNLFNEAMASDTRLVSHILVGKYKGLFEGMKSLVDVGGGTGAMAMALAGAFPDLICTVLDLPRVVAGLESTPNLKFVGGDMFEYVPPADAVILKWILHDWNDEECVKILEQCKKSVKTNEAGKVIVIDMVLDNKIESSKENDKRAETQLFFDMHMLSALTGRERTEKEWVKLINEAGYSRYKISNILGLRSILELFP